MKAKSVAFFIVLFQGTICFGQSTKTNVQTDSPAIVTDWTRRGLLFPESWFDEDATEILQQIDSKEFEQVKKFADMRQWPKPAVFSPGDMRDSTTATYKDYYTKLNALKLFKIARFKHYWKGDYWGDFVILKAPYEENKNWDTNSTWNTFYFIVPAETVIVKTRKTTTAR